MASPPTPMRTQPLEFKDFSGGMTDFYLGGPLSKFEQAENLLIVQHGDVGKLFTRQGSEIHDATNYQIPAGAQRIGTLKYFESVLFTHSARKLYYVLAGAWATLQGQTSNDLLPAGVDTTTVLSMSTWKKQLYITSSDFLQKVQKVFQDGSANWLLRVAGLPVLPSDPTIVGGTPGTTFNYLYRFIYANTYTVGTVTYIDRGATREVAASNNTAIAAGAGNTMAISGMTALSNGATYNYPSSVIKEIYRTTDGGSNFFLVASVANGTTTYNDVMTDATLLNQEPLYTEGGAPDQHEPPLCKLVHVVGNRGFFANTKEGSELHPGRFYQSLPDDVDSVPDTFFEEVEDEIVGMSSVQNTPLLLCANGPIYRVDGFIDELGRGFLDPQKISDTAGCVSSMSVVQTLEGVFWAGLDGFYFSDGYRVQCISTGIRDTYKDLITSAARKRRIVGKYDVTEKRIWWSVQRASSATEVDECFVLDLNWGISPDMPFTNMAGGANFNPTALEFIGANLIRADKSGYNFIHRPTLYTDPKINTSAVPSTWTTAPITYDFLSIATDFGSSYARKWVPSVSVVCKDETNLSLQINSINDDGRRTGVLKPIRFRGKITWGDADVLWGDPDLIWNYAGLIDDTRRMPAMNLRCEYKQIQMTNAFVAIVSSDVLGTALVSNAANTATLTDTVTYDWPTVALDYKIAFASDGYVKEYAIITRTDDVLTFTDADNTAPVGTYAWVIRGYPRGEVLSLVSFVLEYAIFGQTQGAFYNAATGEVGASE